MYTFFRVSTVTGKITGMNDMDRELAESCLSPGEVLMPWSETVSAHNHRYDFRQRRWVVLDQEPVNYRLMRSTGYSEIIGDQIGCMMEIIQYILKGEPVPERLATEHQRLMDRIQAVKLENPRVT
jgi:hypothetical protein